MIMYPEPDIETLQALPRRISWLFLPRKLLNLELCIPLCHTKHRHSWIACHNWGVVTLSVEQVGCVLCVLFKEIWSRVLAMLVGIEIADPGCKVLATCWLKENQGMVWWIDMIQLIWCQPRWMKPCFSGVTNMVPSPQSKSSRIYVSGVDIMRIEYIFIYIRVYLIHIHMYVHIPDWQNGNFLGTQKIKRCVT